MGRRPASRGELDCLAVVRPGLEHLCAAELDDLGIRHGAPIPGGIPLRCRPRDLYRANLRLRTATRVLVRAARFPARDFEALRAGVEAADWTPYLRPGDLVDVRVTSHASRLYHTDAVAERVVDGLRAVCGAQPAPAGSGQLLVVRLARDLVTVSVDASGEPLHRRGWRFATAKAPLPATVAAAALLSVGYDGSGPLLDPFCGSGTIAVEAALLASGRPAHRGRGFSLETWPSFAPGTWASVVGEARAGERTAPAPVVGSDRDDGAIAAAAGNARRAGVADRVQLHAAAVSALEPPAAVAGGPASGWIVTNPPWGGRLAGAGDLRDLHASVGRVLRERFPGWRVGLLTGDLRTAGHSGLGLEPAWRTTIGGRGVTLLGGRVPDRG